jgi:hypothetical protein
MIIYLASSPSHAVFFPDVGGATLDSHHGFVVEYGKDWDVDLGACLIRCIPLSTNICEGFLLLSF